MQKISVLIIFILSFASGFSQSGIKKETWSDNPTIHKIDPKHANESAVIIKDLRRTEYIDEAEGLASYKTLHKIIRVNDDKGIESFNRVYLGVSDNGDIVDIKARTILPNGKIINLDRSNIKDLKEEDGSMYKIFAMEGLEKGCEVEYYYTYKRPASFFMREVLQMSIPVLEATVEIISPKRLTFETKTFNITGVEPIIDTSSAEKREVSFIQKNIPGAEEEKYSNYTANLQRIEYKLSYNTSRSATERVFTWNELAKRMYEIYGVYTDKELKKVDNLIDDNKWQKLATEKEKIVAVEHYLKKTIATRENVDIEDADNIEKILKNKITNFRGIARLYGAIYQKLGVNYQHVLTGDRENFTVDRKFENWNNTENHLLYFPGSKKFLAPTRIQYRYPWIEPTWAATNGLFCKTTTIGTLTTAIGEVRQIPLEDYQQTLNNVEADVKLNASLDTLRIDIKQIYSGYAAAIFRASFTFSSEEEQRNILKQLVKFGTNSENIVSSKIENKDFESYTDNKPFVLQADVKAGELVERAGNKILVKIGDIIGPQVEMYQEKPRQFPMEIDFPHILDRQIKFTIPEGYTVKNPDDLKIEHVYKENGTPTMGFTSTFKLEGNLLSISVHEEYRAVSYPLSIYEEYKTIINAAADFNKIVLILEKK